METRNRFLTPLLGFLFLLLLLFSEHAFAANRVILSSGDWQDPTIWFRNRVGDEKDSVSLERGTTALTSSAEVTNLKVATSRDSSAGRLRVATGAVLSASRDIVIGYSGRGTASLELEKGAVTAGFITLNDGPRRDSGARARLVNAGNLSASSLAIVNANPGGTAEILVSGGAIRIADSLTLSSESGSGGLKINAGRLTWGGLFTLGGKGGHDVLEVTGAAPTISGRHCRFENRAALIFTLDQLGVAPIECADTATLSAAIDSFVIDGSDYTGGPTTVPLLVTGNLNGTFDPRDARITGFDEQAFSIRLTRRANDLVLEIEERESQSAGERTHYGYIYWEHGIPTPLSSRRPASFANLYARENPDLIVQTGHYSLRFDADDIRITGFDLIEGSDYLSALHEDVTRFTPADLRLTISADGVDYFCGEGVVQDSEGFHVRLIESGQFLQRFDHDKVVCKSADGRELGQPVRLEVSAWPDRFTLTLDASRVAGAMRASVEFAGSDGRRYSSASGGATTSVTVQAAGYGPGRALEPGDWIPSASRASDNGSLSTRYSPETGALVIEIPPSGS